MSRDVNTFTIIGNIVSKRDPHPEKSDYMWVWVATSSNNKARVTIRIRIKICVPHLVEMVRATPINARCVFMGEFAYSNADLVHAVLIAPTARFYKVENGSKDSKS